MLKKERPHKKEPSTALFALMTRILRLVNRFSMEGPVHNVIQLTQRLPEYDTLVVAGSPMNGEPESRSLFQLAGISCREVPKMGRSIHPVHDFATWVSIRQIIQNFDPHIIHSHCFGLEGISARWVASMHKKAIQIHTYHGHQFQPTTNLKNKLQLRLEKKLCSRMDAVIAISESQRLDIVHHYPVATSQKTVTIPLGIDCNKFQHSSLTRSEIRRQYNLPQDQLIIGIIARLHPIKNHTLFMDCIERLHKQHPKVHGVIIGDGPIKNDLIKLAIEKKLIHSNGQPAITFMGHQTAIEVILHALDLVLLTSDSEGTPVSLMEAQAAGIPVIATDVGGVRDCILPNQTGILVQPNNLNALCDAVHTLITNPSLLKQYSTCGKTFSSEKFDASLLANRCNQLYLSLLNGIHK